MLSWLAAGNLPEKISEVEKDEGEHSQNVREWAKLPPNLSDEDLSPYLLLAASLRGETIEAAALPADLRPIASDLSQLSSTKRRDALRQTAELDDQKKAVIAAFLARSLRQQRGPDAQKALAESISGLSKSAAVAATAADELRRMPHGSLTAGVPLALLAHNQPSEFEALVREWVDSPDVVDLVRNAGREALKEK
jgi:hypothetical protein